MRTAPRHLILSCAQKVIFCLSAQNLTGWKAFTPLRSVQNDMNIYSFLTATWYDKAQAVRRATDYSDLSKSDERDSGKTREKAQPIYLSRLSSAASSRQ